MTLAGVHQAAIQVLTSPDSKINEHGGVVEGSIEGEFGNRKPPSSAYATLSPHFYADANLGKVKVPTLRNVALGSCEAASVEGCIVKAYMHNGYFKSLKSVVHFYNTRDTKPSCESLKIYDATEEVALDKGCWPKPEVSKNIEVGNMGDSIDLSPPS